MGIVSNRFVIVEGEPVVKVEENWLCTLEELERRHVERVLDHVRGNKAAAARILGIERKTLYRMLGRWAA